LIVAASDWTANKHGNIDSNSLLILIEASLSLRCHAATVNRGNVFLADLPRPNRVETPRGQVGLFAGAPRWAIGSGLMLEERGDSHPDLPGSKPRSIDFYVD
jgi:hypothetical protein